MIADIFYEIFLSQRVFDMRKRGVVICAHSMGALWHVPQSTTMFPIIEKSF